MSVLTLLALGRRGRVWGLSRLGLICMCAQRAWPGGWPIASERNRRESKNFSGRVKRRGVSVRGSTLISAYIFSLSLSLRAALQKRSTSVCEHFFLAYLPPTTIDFRPPEKKPFLGFALVNLISARAIPSPAVASLLLLPLPQASLYSSAASCPSLYRRPILHEECSLMTFMRRVAAEKSSDYFCSATLLLLQMNCLPMSTIWALDQY